MNTVTPCNHYLIRVRPPNVRRYDPAKTLVLMRQTDRRFNGQRSLLRTLQPTSTFLRLKAVPFRFDSWPSGLLFRL